MGFLVKHYPIHTQGQGEITVQASELSAGMYLGSLVIDGIEKDTKCMILSNEDPLRRICNHLERVLGFVIATELKYDKQTK